MAILQLTPTLILREALMVWLGMGVKVATLPVIALRITLAAGVVTWARLPIKLQADMGILLTFMFIWNMVGAL